MAFNPMTVNTPPEAAPHIYAEDDAAVFQSIFGGDGILSVGSRFKTEVKTNNLVRLNDGVLCVGGHLGRIKYADYEDCVIENGETGYNRNDLIIGSFSNNGEHTIDEMKIEVLKGKVTTGIAEDPVVTQGDLYQGEQLRQVPIARVKLEGLNIVSVDMLLPVIPTIPTINKYLLQLSDGLKCNGTVTKIQNIANNTPTKVTIQEDGWYYVRALNSNVSGSCQAYMLDSNNAEYLSGNAAPNSQYVRATTAPIYLEKGSVVYCKSFHTDNGALFRLN